MNDLTEFEQLVEIAWMAYSDLITNSRKDGIEMNDLTEFEQLVEIACRELAQTIIKKNRDYGDSHKKTIEKFGEVVTLWRLNDKLNRLEHLIINNPERQVNESVEDTLLDLAGYSVLEYARRRS